MYTINRRGHGAVVGAADDGLADGGSPDGVGSHVLCRRDGDADGDSVCGTAVTRGGMGAWAPEAADR